MIMAMQNKIYQTPSLYMKEMGESLMSLNLPVSNGEVDDEAAKDRHDVEFEDKDWGNTDNSLW